MVSESINGIEVLVEPNEKYIQVNDTNESGLRGAWPQIKEHFKGHQAMFCYHNMQAPETFLKKIGAGLLDDALEMRLPSNKFTPLILKPNECKYLMFSDKY